MNLRKRKYTFGRSGLKAKANQGKINKELPKVEVKKEEVTDFE